MPLVIRQQCWSAVSETHSPHRETSWSEAVGAEADIKNAASGFGCCRMHFSLGCSPEYLQQEPSTLIKELCVCYGSLTLLDHDRTPREKNSSEPVSFFFPSGIFSPSLLVVLKKYKSPLHSVGPSFPSSLSFLQSLQFAYLLLMWISFSSLSLKIFFIPKGRFSHCTANLSFQRCAV